MSGIFRSIKISPFGGRKMDDWKPIADAIVGTIKDRAKGFWDQNEAGRKFVTERAERLAKLTIEYKLASDDQVKEEKKAGMELVKATIETELLSLALIGAEQTRVTFREIVNTAFSAIVKVLPAII